MCGWGLGRIFLLGGFGVYLGLWSSSDGIAGVCLPLYLAVPGTALVRALLH